MLLEIAIELAVLQVVEGEGPPKSGDLGQFRCPACKVGLHGHGWRRRYFINDALESLQIWIHRKLCPCCQRTYTLLPSWVHAFKLFGLGTIARMLSHRAEKGRFKTTLGISGYLQRLWWKGWTDRARSGGEIFNHAAAFTRLEGGLRGCLASPLCVRIVQEVPASRMGSSLLGPSHQRLYLYVPRAIP
jgi:hypothetical protein